MNTAIASADRLNVDATIASTLYATDLDKSGNLLVRSNCFYLPTIIPDTVVAKAIQAATLHALRARSRYQRNKISLLRMLLTTRWQAWRQRNTVFNPQMIVWLLASPIPGWRISPRYTGSPWCAIPLALIGRFRPTMQTRRNFISFWHDLDPPGRAELQAIAQDAGIDLIEHFDLSEQDLKPFIAPEVASHQQSLLQFVIELPRQSD